MLQARRYRRAADELERRLAAESGYRYRSAPLPRHLRRASLELAEAVYEPERLGEALRDLLLHPPPIDVDHMHVVHPRVSVAARLAHLRKLLRRGSFTFDEAVRGADRVTIATTLFALLELHKQGEATWAQPEPFGEITVSGREGASGSGERAA
jgi:segregation and condensation protein A